MRVLLVTKGLDLGGVERVVVDLAVGLSARGVDVEVAVVNSRRDRLAPVLDAAGITAAPARRQRPHRRRCRPSARPARHRPAIRRRPRPRSAAHRRRPTRDPWAQDGQFIAHPVEFTADPDPHRVARIGRPRRRHHRRVRGGRRIAPVARPRAGRRDPPRHRPRPHRSRARRRCDHSRTARHRQRDQHRHRGHRGEPP